MKYELVKTDTKQFGSKTLYRIRALVAIGFSVSAGDLGGYIESEKNLSQLSSDAWVFGDALVSGNAQVSSDAWVSGNARVFGDAQVFGNARVSGDAHVFGNARVFGDARVSSNARVSSDAQVFGDAWVSGYAQVLGDARVFGNAQVSSDALVSGNARVFGYAQVFGDARVSGDALVLKPKDWLLIGPAKSSGRFTSAFIDKEIGVRVVCGCFTGSVLEFSKQIEQTHADDKEYLEQYRLFCQLIAFNFGVTE